MEAFLVVAGGILLTTLLGVLGYIIKALTEIKVDTKVTRERIEHITKSDDEQSIEIDAIRNDVTDHEVRITKLEVAHGT